MAVARFAAAARRVHLLPCLMCLLLVAAAGLNLAADMDDGTTPALFQIEPEDGQQVQGLEDTTEAEPDAELELLEGGDALTARSEEQVESAAVQEMKRAEKHHIVQEVKWQEVAQRVERGGSSGTGTAAGTQPGAGVGLKARAVHTSPNRDRHASHRHRHRHRHLRRRMVESGCDANPAVCLDPSNYPAGPTCCDGRCVNTNYDDRNCGYCGNTCPFGTTCCIGLCIDTQSDSSNCGRCGNECPLGDTCAFGFCGYGYS